MYPKDVDVQPASIQLERDKISTHKITYMGGPRKYVYWYTKRGPGGRDFDRLRNWELVKRLYEYGTGMAIGADETLTIRDGAKYSLTRRSADEFIVESLN